MLNEIHWASSTFSSEHDALTTCHDPNRDPPKIAPLLVFSAHERSRTFLSCTMESAYDPTQNDGCAKTVGGTSEAPKDNKTISRILTTMGTLTPTNDTRCWEVHQIIFILRLRFTVRVNRFVRSFSRASFLFDFTPHQEGVCPSVTSSSLLSLWIRNKLAIWRENHGQTGKMLRIFEDHLTRLSCSFHIMFTEESLEIHPSYPSFSNTHRAECWPSNSVIITLPRVLRTKHTLASLVGR